MPLLTVLPAPLLVEARLRVVAVVLERVPADEVFDEHAPLAGGGVFETEDGHAVAGGAAAPAFVAIFGADVAGGDQLQVGGGADVEVPVGALRAVEAGDGWGDGVFADVALGAQGEGDVVFRLRQANQVGA